METLWLPVGLGEKDKQSIQTAAAALCTGGVVAIPTETVYGLAANALDEKAVMRIFEAKGRPQDNPLIVHIPEPEDIDKLCEPVPDIARRLALRFWPGPLTMVLKARELIPKVVTAGLDTVAIRCPSHPVALAILREAGVPLAAPSANRSGAPSPTEASHVKADMQGRIDAIVAAGTCSVGVESTVVDLTGDVPRLLRPGGITREQLLTVLDKLEEPGFDETSAPPAPGMKYRHYAPETPLLLLHGSLSQRVVYLRSVSVPYGVLCYEGEQEAFGDVPVVVLAPKDNGELAAKRLFSSLRKLDALRVDTLYAPFPDSIGLWHTVRNRLLKAASGQVIDL